ncbi:proline/serine-rich coiled-coil protein 1 isoform X3 [Sphaerodactylus townsendi]|uniref:proline/serine-rich coiled-coil protein 1 isoform X3 n=1 Tax=Sphaerodactylus townsendi TaxID=933632 RepID=UPI00202735A9|nr:proline/serine-rich coiled-coil protein 1 isoform X3 [Sphaerodactylus townsendi]
MSGFPSRAPFCNWASLQFLTCLIRYFLENMELLAEEIKFITDETLDFGLSSPSDGLEENFVTHPREPSERSLAQSVDMDNLSGESRSKAREQWSPLSPERMEEIRKEANMLAAQMEKCQLLEKENASSDLRPEKVPEFEPFSPIRFLRTEDEGTRNSRRKTFNVNNSPLIALLPRVGTETYLAQNSPKVWFPKKQSPTGRVANVPVSKKLPNKTNSCSADSHLFKKSRSSKSPNVSPAIMPHSGKKSQASNRSSKSRPSPLTRPGTTENQNLPLDSKPALQTTKRGLPRKMKEVSGQTYSAQDPKLKLQDSPCADTMPIAHGKGKLKPRMYPSQTSSVKKSCSVQDKVPLQKAKAGRTKTMGGHVPQLQASSELPHNSSCQTRTRSVPASSLATKLPVPKSIPKPTSPIIASGRHAAPGRPSQLKPLSSGLSGRKGSTVSTLAGKKASAFKQTLPSGTSQSSRLQLPKKAIPGSSR